mmetsp:Transcript_68415/g.127670  ORF Transcript_68415/g.127670 Transcript_68415/m.127670 type:complete len:226 (+) Transcript_68415:65-742(+)
MAEAEAPQETIELNIGGQVFQVLEQTLRSKPDTLLCTMLDDPARTDKHAPLFVEADPERFRYILDWYRYGSMLLPESISIAEMRRECAFYQLPDHVKICRERPTAADIQEAASAAAAIARERVRVTQTEFLAALVIFKLTNRQSEFFRCADSNVVAKLSPDDSAMFIRAALDAAPTCARVDAAVEALVSAEGCTVVKVDAPGDSVRKYTIKALTPEERGKVPRTE